MDNAKKHAKCVKMEIVKQAQNHSQVQEAIAHIMKN